MIYWLGYFFVALLDRIFFTCSFVNRQVVPAQGPCIIASNHLSYIDPLIIGISRRRKFSFMAKDSLFENRFSSFFLNQVGAFPIKRDTSDFRAIREAMKRLKKGFPLILFPEGTRGAGKREKKIQPGIGLIAVRSQVPVIPAFIEDSDKALAHDAKWFKRHPVKITFGQPMTFQKDQPYQEIASRIMDSIYELAPS